MNKIILILIAIIIIAILATAIIVIKQKRSARNPEISKQELQQKFQTLKTQYEKAKTNGYDVSEIENIGRQAKQAFDKGDYKKVNTLLEQVAVLLKSFETPVLTPVSIPTPIPTPTSDSIPQSTTTNKEEARKKLSNVKVASQYRRVADIPKARSLDDTIGILKETKTDLIFQGWMRQNPCPDFCSDLPVDQQAACVNQAYSYECLREAVSKTKKELPNVIFVGGFLAEFLDPDSRNELTGKTYSRDELWGMVSDPSKWGIKQSKEEFQIELAIRFNWTKQGQLYNPKEQMHYYFPDITNSEVQELFLSWGKKQIDSGVDALWIDALYGQAELFYDETGDINHIAVKESYEASNNIIDELHKYGISKGKYVYIISWARDMMLEAPYAVPDMDGVMLSVGTEEIRNLKMNEKKWDGYKTEIKKLFGDVPIFARIDYGNVKSPLAVFSQELTIGQANQFLRIADEYLQEKEIKFIYPISGGNMGSIGNKGNKLSYGKYDWYDSLAPEFDTYETIKELANEKLE